MLGWPTLCSSLLFLWSPLTAGSPALHRYGNSITVPWPNTVSMLGLSGLTYDSTSQLWTAPAESIPGAPESTEYVITSKPRIYRFKLDFRIGAIEHATPVYVEVKPSANLKLEDIAATPSDNSSFWVVSETNSDMVHSVLDTFSAGRHDINTYDQQSFAHSRLLRISASDGRILEEVPSLAFTQWNQKYDWDWSKCSGNRVFQGFHAMSVSPAVGGAGAYNLMVASQSALYQDGPTCTQFEGSPIRILMYSVAGSDAAPQYTASYRYDTAEKTIHSDQKNAEHYCGVFGMLLLSESSLLVAEFEGYKGFGTSDATARIFHVTLDTHKAVDHCTSLSNCDIPAPEKRLVWEKHGRNDGDLDGMAWGPDVMVNGHSMKTIALVFESDAAGPGAHFELFTLDEAALQDLNLWPMPEGPMKMQHKHTLIISNSCWFVLLVAAFVYFLCGRLQTDERIPIIGEGEQGAGPPAAESARNVKNYLLGSCILNSFLLGGITFGYPAVVLILQKEGVFAENCSCGTFCIGQRERFAAVSVLGFAATIGARLFIGTFLDKRGPKETAVASGCTCLAAFIMLSCCSNSQDIGTWFLPAWLLLCIGGSGLHLSGFHATRLYDGREKTAAAAALSTAFGSSALMPSLMQFLSQFGDVSLQVMAVVYALLTLLVTFNNFLIQPHSAAQPGMEFAPSFRFWQTAWWRTGNKSRRIIPGASKIMKRFDFWGETLFFAFNLLAITYYLSIVPQLLYDKGAINFTKDPNDWDNYQFQRLAALFNGLGFLWMRPVNAILTYTTWSGCLCLVLFSNIVFMSLLAMPWLEVQVLAFALQSFVRLMLFSSHHTYLLEKFGIEYFGVLNGVSCLIASMVGLLSYPYQLFTIFVAGGHDTASLGFIAVGLLVSSTCPLLLRRQKVSNWAETSFVDPKKFVFPTSIESVRNIVRHANKVRVAGAMHSCAPLVDCDEVILSSEHLNRIVYIDLEKRVARVQAGVTIHQLCEALAKHDLAVGTLGTIDWQTVVGAVMTGTHGGSITTPALHAFMEAYKIVKADGSILEVKRGSPPFPAMAPSLGVFGVVVEAEIRCVPLQYLEARFSAMPFKEMIPKLKEIYRQNKYARIVVYPTIEMATIWTANPIDPNEAVAKGAKRVTGYMNFRDEYEKVWLESWIEAYYKENHDQADALLRKVLDSQLRRLEHYVGQYNHILCKERNHGIPHADMEFGFDVERCEDVLNVVREDCQKNRYPYYNFEVRCTMKDDAMLSVSHDRDTMWIDFQAKAGPGQREYFGKMEDLLRHVGYRKHWAKGMDHMDPDYIMGQFPRLKEFMALQLDFDPQGKFVNKHVEYFFKELTSGTVAPRRPSITSVNSLDKVLVGGKHLKM